MKRRWMCTLLMAAWLLPAALQSQEEPIDDGPGLEEVTTRLQEGDVVAAIQLLEELVQAEDPPVPAMALLGALYLEVGRAADALHLLRDLAEVDEPDPAVLYNAGRAASLAGDPALAERYLKRSVTLQSGTPAARELGLLLGNQARYSEALVLLSDWTRSHPDDVEGRLAAAVCAIELERPREAEEMLSDLPQTEPTVRLLWGRLLLLQGDPWGALATLKPALEEAPPELELELRRLTAEAHALVGEASSAIELLEGYEEESPELALQLSLAQYQSGDSAGALETIRPWAERLLPDPAGELDSTLVAGLALQYGRLLVREDRSEEALPFLELASRAQPSATETWQVLGQALASMGRQAEATEALQRFQELSAEESARVKDSLGRREELEDPTGRAIAETMELIADNRPEAALERIQAEKALVPNDVRPRLLEARLLLELDRAREALEAVRQILELAPEDADAIYLRGAIRIRTEQRQDAESDLRRALELEPEHIAAMNDLAVLLMARGESAEARQLLERVLELNPGDPLAKANLESIDRP